MRYSRITEEEFTRMAQRVRVSRPRMAPLGVAVRIQGVAMGKPRMTQCDKWKQRPVVLRYRAWCDKVRAFTGPKRTLLHPMALHVRFYLPMPVSWTDAQRIAAHAQAHTHKPDIDNLVKGLVDAMFQNDEWVYAVDARKFFTNEDPHVVVRLEEVP